jgi:hypothetical protein
VPYLDCGGCDLGDKARQDKLIQSLIDEIAARISLVPAMAPRFLFGVQSKQVSDGIGEIPDSLSW